MSAQHHFLVWEAAVIWASEEQRLGFPEGYSGARENWHALLSRRTASSFAREVREMGMSLARDVKALRELERKGGKP